MKRVQIALYDEKINLRHDEERALLASLLPFIVAHLINISPRTILPKYRKTLRRFKIAYNYVKRNERFRDSVLYRGAKI